ncbi:type IV toxin-antitoxin system AbiEi family antitoxin [Nocardia sp. NPDC057353]|uniref:type IV toxin-antitoxin system AbiEi family antitoxin n=1 Tax=Nocardia sp. NPDC057353 TaxID=3346104 RepID=UPI00363AC372
MQDRTQRAEVELAVSRALSQLPIEFELRGLSTDGLVRVAIDRSGASAEYRVAWLPHPTLSEVSKLERRADEAPLLVTGPRISVRTADRLRGAGIDYADLAGNAHLARGPLLIDIQGRRPSTERNQRVPGEANLFSARRMQVIFALLAWPDLAGAPVRILAEVAGASIGLAQSTIGIMRNSGYLIGRSLHRRDELLDLWTGAYRTSLLPKLHLHSFAGDPTHRSLPPGYLISGESAVTAIRNPQTLTLYVEDFDFAVGARSGWRRSKEPNIDIRRKFWITPPGWEQPDLSEFAGIAAPPLLVYADLLATQEPRQAEVAETLRKARRV